MGQDEQLSDTVEKLYAAALDPSRWREALVAVENFTGSTGVVIDLVPLVEGVAPQTFAGSFSSEDCTDYALHYQAICPRIAFGRAHPDVAIHYDQLIMSEREMDRDPVYEWFGKHGLRYYIGGVAGATKRHSAYFSLQRSIRQGHAGAADIAKYTLLQPHLAQALAIADSFDTLAAHRRFSDAMLDALPQAVFGLDVDGVLMFANASADRLLARGDCLRYHAGRLVTSTGADQQRLDALIADAIAGRSGGALRVGRADGRPPCAVRVSPIMVDEAERFLRPAVLVIANDPAGPAAIDEGALQAIYGLTRAEARAAAALLEGHSVKSAAELLEVGAETMRSHLKSVFRKVGVSRQQDLVRVLVELERATPGSTS